MGKKHVLLKTDLHRMAKSAAAGASLKLEEWIERAVQAALGIAQGEKSPSKRRDKRAG